MTTVVLSYSENSGAASEAASAAEALARQGGGEAFAVEIGELGSGSGAKSRLVLKGSFPAEVTPEVAAEAIFRAAGKVNASVILVGATRSGRETAARIAAKQKAGCLAEVAKLMLDGPKLSGERNAYAGKVLARVECAFPAVATVKLGSYPKAQGGSAAQQEVDVGAVEQSAKVVSKSPKEVGAVDLKSAKTIVSAGRGVKKKEDLQLLEELAKAMKGALGCSRPLSSDLGWLPEEHHIGLTGVNVKPDLYLAVGISGQLQHIAGIRDSKVVAAINTDKDAPIFQAADYGVVGDLYQVVPALLKVLGAGK